MATIFKLHTRYELQSFQSWSFYFVGFVQNTFLHHSRSTPLLIIRIKLQYVFYKQHKTPDVLSSKIGKILLCVSQTNIALHQF